MDLNNINIKSYIKNDDKYLYLSKCQIKTIAENTFEGLNQVISLQLQKNEITQVKENTFSGLESTKDLYLHENKITTLRKYSFNGLKLLISLHLENNDLKVIKENTFNGLDNLKDLYLYENKIERLENDSFRGLRLLKSLNLKNNKVKEIKKYTFNGLEYLKYLYLDNNIIESIEDSSFNGLRSLRTLHLTQNNIKAVKINTFNGLCDLKELYLSNNEIELVESNSFNRLNSLKFLHLAKNNIKEIKENTFNGLVSLTELDLSFNGIEQFETKSFNILYNLENLYLFPLQMDSINSNVFCELKSLENISVFNRNVNFFPNFKKQNIEITKLNFEIFCKKNFQNQFSKFDITGNALSSVELTAQKWKNFKNPFKWEKIPNKFAVIIGLNGTGKTNLLKLIDDSINNGQQEFIKENSKYFKCKLFLTDSAQTKQNDSDSLRQEIYQVENIIEFIYDSLNEFNLVEYYDFLILYGYQYNDLDVYFEAKQFHYKLSRVYFKKRQKEMTKLIQKDFGEYYNRRKIDSIEQCFEEYNSDESFSFSPGERMILMFYLWTFHAQQQAELLKDKPIRNKLRILLLDEPDAYMHPSLIKEIINMFLDNRFEYLNVQIIMTTHSPVTLSFIPQENIFELKRDLTNKIVSIRPIRNKKQLIYSFSGNLFFLKETFKIVLVEGTRDDKEFYSMVLEKYLAIFGEEKKTFPIIFQSMGGKQFNQIFEIQEVNDIADNVNLNEMIYGINDGDYCIEQAYHLLGGKMKETKKYESNFRRLSRYNFENYVYDPINLAFALNYLIKKSGYELKDLTLDDSLNTYYNYLINFIEKIQNHIKISEFISQEKNFAMIFNYFLAKTSNFYLQNIN